MNTDRSKLSNKYMEVMMDNNWMVKKKETENGIN